MDKYYYHDNGIVEVDMATRLVARALAFRWQLILCVAAVPVLLTTLAYWTMEPKFSATARILIDPRPRQVLENEVAKTGMGTSSQGGDLLMLDSQEMILGSRELLSNVIIAQGLDRDEPARSTFMVNLRQVVRWLERGPQSASLPDHSSMEMALKRLLSNLRIDRVGNTYVFDVTYSSPDRNQAATVANALIAEYIRSENQDYRSRIQENVDSLNKMVAALRTESERTSLQLAEHRAQSKNNLLHEIKLNEIQTQAELNRENLRIVSARTIQAKVEQGFPSDTVRLISKAEPSTYPSGPKPALVLLASALIGLFAGASVAWIRHLLNGTPEARNNVEQATSLANLVRVAHPDSQPMSPEANDPLPQQLFKQRHPA